MALAIVTPSDPMELVVPVAEAKEHMRVDTDVSDALVGNLIRSVTDWLAGRNGWLGRSLLRQRLALTVPLPLLPGFTGPVVAHDGMTGITLPRPPVIDVESVEMIDAQREAFPVAPTGYTTHEGDDGLTHLLFLPDFRWPVIATGPAFVRVTYSAGYGEKSEDIDAGLRHAILMSVARLHEARGDPMQANLQDDPMIARMFAPYRVWTVR